MVHWLFESIINHLHLIIAQTILSANHCTFSDVGEALNGQLGQAKDAVVGAAQAVGHGLDNAVHSTTDKVQHQLQNVLTGNNDNNADSLKETDYTHIPLKDTTVADDANEHMTEFKESLEKTAQSYNDEIEQLSDELMKETSDVVSDGIMEVENKIVESIKNESAEMMDNKTPTHSIDSLKTNSPEPEIEKALSNDEKKSPPSPKPTLKEFESMNLTNNKLQEEDQD